MEQLDQEQMNIQEISPFDIVGNETEKTVFADEEKQQAEALAAPKILEELNAPLSPEEKKKLHEEEEAKRKAEWETAMNEKNEKVLIQWEETVCVSNDVLIQKSTNHIETDTERLTRRNMKICVSDYIKVKCLTDMNLARHTLYPKKSMVNCFRYINKKAMEYIKQEMADNDIKPDNEGYGTDVPDDLCYKWAEEYFLDLDAEIDMDDKDKFVPKPYNGPMPKAKKQTKKTEKKPAKKEVSNDEMIYAPSLLEQAQNMTESSEVI